MTMRCSKERDRLCLIYPLFEGDETYVTPLRNRMVMVRYSHQCVVCWHKIAAGLRVRAVTECNHETKQVMTFYCCPTCCDAMAKSWKDNGRAICERTSIGIARANRQRRKRAA